MLLFCVVTSTAVFQTRENFLKLHTKAVRITDCGRSPDEAIANGCVVESHNFAWTAPGCYDQELDERWNAQAWATYATPTAASFCPVDEVLEGRKHFLTTFTL